MNNEDIKVLEEFIRIYKELNKKSTDFYFNKAEIPIEIIENLIKGYKELELCLKAEEQYSKGLNNDIKSLLNIEPNTNFIHKDKVREKIEQLKFVKNTVKNTPVKDNKYTYKECIEYRIEDLQELLEEIKLKE